MDFNRIDWAELRIRQRSKLTPESTEAELFRVLDETLTLLNDNHAYLEAPGLDLEAEESPEDIETVPSENALPEFGDFQVAQMVAAHHLEEDLTKDSGLIQWGRLTDSIGYIQVKAMWLFAELEIPQADIDELGYVDAYIRASDKMYEGTYIKREVAGASTILDRALADLADTRALVIDIRFNGGGQDAISFEILSRFLPDTLQVATQKLKIGNDRYTSPQKLLIQGVSQPYTKPIFILTSRQTGSAAEAFAIATMAMKNAWRIGTPTSGALSTALEKTLPNGWVFSISNEVYMDNWGTSYEYQGIPVDYPLDYPEDRQVFFRSVANDLKADKERILEAIENLRRDAF
jgi:C-terminal processing protease CtpA/Prc